MPAYRFLIIHYIFVGGNALCSGQGSSDFPRLEYVSEHVEEVYVSLYMFVCMLDSK